MIKYKQPLLGLILATSLTLGTGYKYLDPSQCLEPDSVPPHCSDYVSDVGEPVFIEHVFNCSRFWVCQPDLSDCLFECAPMLPEGNLYFDVRYQYPVGPVCDWPSSINCTNRPECCGECQVWQECDDSIAGICNCTPNCKVDVHCDDDEYCDYPDGGEGLCQVGCRNGAVCGDNVKPCGKCVDHECTGEPECCSDADCTEPGEKCEDGVCKFECVTDDDCEDNEYCEGGQCLLGCNADSDCADSDCSTCSLSDHSCFNPECCSDDDCDSTEYCDAGTCVIGCNENSDCTDMSCSFCGTNHLCVNPECCADSECTDMTCSTCGADNTCLNPECCSDSDCTPDQYCDNTICVAGCNEDSDCGNSDCSFCGTDNQCVDPECCKDSECMDMTCSTCSSDNTCVNPECCSDDDCTPDQYCDDNICIVGCNEDSDCGNTDCSFCGTDNQCVDPECCKDSECMDMTCSTCSSDNTCVNPECCSDDDCDPTTPICTDNYLCVEGCRSDEGCPGYNAICDSNYSNCNYCNITENVDFGSCNPGCITNENCADPLECYVDHECKEPPSFLSLKQIIFDTATCDNCQGTNEEDGPKLQIIGGEGKDGTPMCDTEGLDHADRVDFATGTIAVFDDKDDKDVLGTCYRADLLGEVTGGSITWTASTGSWRLEGDQVDFSWSNADQCKYSCCLDNPTLSAAAPTANLVNCKKNCGDNLVC